MARTPWWQTLFPAAGRPARRTARPAPSARLRLVCLEDRAVPANNILIATGGATTIPAAATTFTDTTDVTIDPTAFAALATPVTLQANQTITVNSPVALAGAGALTAQAKGTIAVNQAVTATTSNLTFSGNEIDFNLTGQPGSQVTGGTGTLTLAPFDPARNIVLGDSTNVTLNAVNLTLQDLNATRFPNIVIGQATGTGTISTASAGTTIGAQANVTLLTSATGAVTIIDPVTDVGGDFSIVTGTASDSSTVSVTAGGPLGAGGNLTVDADNLALSGGFGSVSGSGTLSLRPLTQGRPITLGGPLTLPGNSLVLNQDPTFADGSGLNSTAFGTIVIGGVYDAAVPTQAGQTYAGAITTAGDTAAQADVTIQTAGAITIANDFTDVPQGGNPSPGNLTLINGGTLTIGSAAGTTSTVAGTIAQTGTGPVVVTGTAALTSNNAGISFAGPIDGSATGVGALTLSAANGTVALSQGVGANLVTGGASPAGLTVTGKAVTLGGGFYATTGNQTYSGPVTATGLSGVTLSAGTTTDTTATLTVNNALTAAGDLTLLANQLALNGGLGSVSGPGTLTLQPVNQTEPIILGGTAPTAGSLSLIQNFMTGAGNLNATKFNSVVIGGYYPVLIFNDVYAGNITTAGDLQAQANVTLRTLGNVTLTNNVLDTPAGTAVAGNLAVDVGGTLTLGTTTVTVSGAITQQSQGTTGSPFTPNGAVVVSGNAVLTSSNAGISLAGPVNGSAANTGNLTLTAANGAVALTGTPGATTPLANLTVNAQTAGTAAAPLTFSATTLAVTTTAAGGDFLRAVTMTTVNTLNAGPGTATLTGGAFQLAASETTTSPVVVQPGAVLLGSGTVGPLTVNGTGGTATGTGGIVTPVTLAGTPTTLNSGNATFAAGSSFAGVLGQTPAMGMNTGSGVASELNVTGTVNLGGATLAFANAPGVTPTTGTVFTIVNNDGADPVTGTFNNLPEGAVTTISSTPYRISYAGGTGNDVTLTALAATTTTVTATPATTTSGQAVTVTATVAGGTAGTAVTFTVNGSTTPLATGTLNGNGTVTFTTTTLPVGTDVITATTAAGTTAGGSTGTATVTVNPIATTTTVTASPTTATSGQSVTLTATVTGGTVGQTVTFRVNGSATPLGTATLGANGTATLTTTALPVGTDTITASLAAGTTTGASSGTTTVTVTAPVSPPSPPSPPTSPPNSPPTSPPTTPRRVGESDTGLFAVSAGTTGTVTVFNPDGTVAYTVNPFGPGVAVRAVVADVNGDGTPDVIAGTGPGVAARVVVIDGATKQTIATFTPYEKTFTGGVFVAGGDVNGDGKADVVVSPDVGGSARIEVFSGADGALLANFYGIDDPNFRGGARVAVADINGDGKADIVVAAGESGGPRVAVFSGVSIAAGSTPTRLTPDFFAFEPTLRDGAFVSAGDFNGDGKADLALAGGPSGGPRVLIVDGATLLSSGSKTLSPIANFFAGDLTLRSGAEPAVKRLGADGSAGLVVAVPQATGTRVTEYLGSTLTAQGTPPVYKDLGVTNDPLGVFVG